METSSMRRRTDRIFSALRKNGYLRQRKTGRNSVLYGDMAEESEARFVRFTNPKKATDR